MVELAQLLMLLGEDRSKVLMMKSPIIGYIIGSMQTISKIIARKRVQ